MMMLVPTEAGEEEELVAAAAKGDRAAFGKLYTRYARMVHGILLTRVPPRDAKDLVQDVFVVAMRQLDDLRAVAAFPGWLASIARHRALDYLRGTKAVVPLEDSMMRKHGSDSFHAQALEILDLIRRLPEAYRETLILRLVEGMTGPEIARRTGLKPESVRVNLCRGMKMLRALLGEGR
jgi:RNA polymerase sigma-70 factor (ECF subfamily)